MVHIHPTALVDPRAQLGDGVSIGGYSIIKGPVRIGPGTIIHEQTHVQGNTVIGRECQIGPAAFVGLPPQHLRADLEAGQLIIGDHVIIRETASVHRATHPGEENATRMGNHCFIMGGVHVAHDCRLEDHVIAANWRCWAAIAGSVKGRFSAGGVHSINSSASVAWRSSPATRRRARISLRLPPCVMADSRRTTPAAASVRRWAARRSAIRAAYRCLHSHRVVSAALDEIRETVPDSAGDSRTDRVHQLKQARDRAVICGSRDPVPRGDQRNGIAYRAGGAAANCALRGGVSAVLVSASAIQGILPRRRLRGNLCQVRV